MTIPKIMSPEDELALAAAMLLQPNLFKNMDVCWGHVPKERERHVRRGHRLLKLVRMLGAVT